MTGMVIHAPTGEALQRALNNAKNFRAMRPDIPIEIIVNGQGAKAACSLTPVEYPQGLFICANSIKAQGLTLPNGAHTIPAAIVHLYDRQQAGWHYVRA